METTTCLTRVRITFREFDYFWFLFQEIDGEQIDMSDGVAGSLGDAKRDAQDALDGWVRESGVECAVDVWEVVK